jgi:ABC-type sugar transport system ATPase subunit
MSLADELFVMNEGRIEISGVPIEVYNSGNPVMNSLIGEVE